jgi:hypothetical protein
LIISTKTSSLNCKLLRNESTILNDAFEAIKYDEIISSLKEKKYVDVIEIQRPKYSGLNSHQ